MLAELLGLVIAVWIGFILFRLIKQAILLVFHSVLALLFLVGLNFFGVPVIINLFSFLIVLCAGIPGLVLVLMLHYLGIAF